MATRLTLKLSILLFATVALASEDIGAVPAEPPPPMGWEATLPEAIDGVPTNGVIAVEAVETSNGGQNFEKDVSFEVTAASGAVLPGALEYMTKARLLVWRPTDGFDPNTTYTASVHIDNTWMEWGNFEDIAGDITVTTGDGPALPVGQPVVVTATPSQFNSFSPCRNPALMLTIGNDPDGQPNNQVVIVAGKKNDSVTWPQNGGWHFAARPQTPQIFGSWNDRADQYCFTLETRSLADGSSMLIHHCEEHDRHFFDSPTQPWCDDDGTFNSGGDAFVGTGSGGMIGGGEVIDSTTGPAPLGEGGPGCTVGSMGFDPPTPVTFFVLIVGMLALRRRRPVRARSTAASLVALSLVVIAGAPLPANAIAPAAEAPRDIMPTKTLVVPDTMSGIPVDGLIVVQAQVVGFGGWQTEVLFTVTDADGNELTGQVEHEFDPQIIAWRPDALFEAGAVYHVALTLQDDMWDVVGDDLEFDVQIAAEPVGDFVQPALLGATPSRMCSSQCCNPQVTLRLAPTDEGMPASQTVYKLYVLEDFDIVSQTTVYVTDGVVTGTMFFPEARDEYCIQVTASSLIDPENVQTWEYCEQHDRLFFDTPNQPLCGIGSFGFIDGLIEPAPREAAGCTASGRSGAGAAAVVMISLLGLLLLTARRRPIVLLALLLVSRAAVADMPMGEGAAAPPDPPYWAANLPELVEDIPTDGILRIKAYMGGWGSGETAPDGTAHVDVTDTDGEPVAGALTVDETLQIIIWRPDALLAANAQYTVSVFLDNTWTEYQHPDVQGEFAFTTADGVAPPLAEPVLFGATPNKSCNAKCCMPGIRLRYDYPDSEDALDAQWVMLSARSYDTDGAMLSGANHIADVIDQFEMTTLYDQQQSEYCFELFATSLLDDEVRTIEFCEEHSRLFFDNPELPWCTPEDFMNEDFEDDHMTPPVVPGKGRRGDTPGCTLGSTGAAGGSAAPVFLLLILVMIRRTAHAA